MAFAKITSGQTLMSLATYVDLTTQTGTNIFELSVDTTGIVNGETLTLRVKKKARSAGSEQIVDELVIAQHLQTNFIKETKPYTSIEGSITFALKQDGGSARTLDWTLAGFA